MRPEDHNVKIEIEEHYHGGDHYNVICSCGFWDDDARNRFEASQLKTEHLIEKVVLPMLGEIQARIG